jgi:hypothetical protein
MFFYVVQKKKALAESVPPGLLVVSGATSNGRITNKPLWSCAGGNTHSRL